MDCEFAKLSGTDDSCGNDVYANITVTGDNGSMTIDICEEHLNALTSQFPVEESEEARSSR